MEPATATIASGRLTAVISSLGAELLQLMDSGGHQLLWDGDPAFWRGRAPILFPVIGLLNGGQYRLGGRAYTMPKHGFARQSIFEVVTNSTSAATFRLTSSPETRVIYPFDFVFDVDFAIEGPELTVAASIANLGDTAMPASFGFHPALRWPLPFGRPRAEHRIVFDTAEPASVRRIDADGLLISEPEPTPVVGDTLGLRDDLFVADALIFDRLTSRRVRYGANDGPGITVHFSDFPILGVWTKPGAGFICIEPWQGLPDPRGFSGDIHAKPGVVEIEPGATRRLAMTIGLGQETQNVRE